MENETLAKGITKLGSLVGLMKEKTTELKQDTKKAIEEKKMQKQTSSTSSSAEVHAPSDVQH